MGPVQVVFSIGEGRYRLFKMTEGHLQGNLIQFLVFCNGRRSSYFVKLVGPVGALQILSEDEEAGRQQGGSPFRNCGIKQSCTGKVLRFRTKRRPNR